MGRWGREGRKKGGKEGTRHRIEYMKTQKNLYYLLREEGERKEEEGQPKGGDWSGAEEKEKVR